MKKRQTSNPLRFVYSLAAVLLVACTSDAPPPTHVAPDPPLPATVAPQLAAPQIPRSVFVISLDTVRADAFAGWRAPTPPVPPALDALLNRSARFSTAIAAAPTTLASHTSLFTSTAPHTHGAANNYTQVHPRNWMMTEYFAGAGYSTGAILGAMPLGEHSGFLQGFQHIDATMERTRASHQTEQAERPAPSVTEATLRWLETVPPGQPVFGFVHYFDAHTTWTPPEPWRSRALAKHPFASGDEGSMAELANARALLRRNNPQGERLLGILRSLYEAEIYAVEAEVARLLEGLKAMGRYEDSLIVLVADHGEVFFREEEQLSHGASLYQEAVHVPLLIAAPGHAGVVVDTPVSTLDVFPTLLDLLKVPSPPHFEGRSLRAALSAPTSLSDRPVYSEATKPTGKGSPWKNQDLPKSVQLGREKLIFTPRTGRQQFYDLGGDPFEARPTSTPHLPQSQSLMTSLERYMSQASPFPAENTRAPDITVQLKALGYVQ